jgi:hypothetical protein
MIVDYSKEDGLLSATRDTFSGERPCHLCHRISEAKENDDSKPTPLTAPDHSRLLQDMLPSRTASVPPPHSPRSFSPDPPASSAYRWTLHPCHRHDPSSPENSPRPFRVGTSRPLGACPPSV